MSTKPRPPSHQPNVRADLADLRDVYYRPSLRPLKDEFITPYLFKNPDAPSDGLRIAVRNQGDEGSCTGQALASLVDIMRASEAPEEKPGWMASARMMLEMAKLQEPWTNPSEIYSLRAALKGFYHNGVCSDEFWPYRAKEAPGIFTAERSTEARRVGLGAYYRLRPLLDDYHAALNETGCIYVAAKIHQGWYTPLKDGAIQVLDTALADEGHAFLIVGYARGGFVILNSWGTDWGGYKGLDGLALWTYQDWADTIMDAWVARLSVSTPEAFDIAICEQGLGGSGEAISATSSALVIMPGRQPSNAGPASTPRSNLIGHYAHFEDGTYMRRGPYPSDAGSVEQTLTILEEQKMRDAHDHVLLWIEGGSEPIDELVRLAAKAKQAWLNEGVYPYHLIWCADFAKESHDVLATLFERAKERAGGRSDNLDIAIEDTVRGIGRAFWRDIARAAREATKDPDTDCVQLLDGFARVCRKMKYALHIVVEGSAALLLGEIVKSAEEAGQLQAVADTIKSLSLIAPPLRVDQVDRCLMPLTQALAEKKRHATLYVPSEDLEARMRVGAYGRSILHLISNAFEDRREPLSKDAPARRKGLRGPPLLGMSLQCSGIVRDAASGLFGNMLVKEVPAMRGKDPGARNRRGSSGWQHGDDWPMAESLGMSAMRRNPLIAQCIHDRIIPTKKRASVQTTPRGE